MATPREPTSPPTEPPVVALAEAAAAVDGQSAGVAAGTHMAGVRASSRRAQATGESPEKKQKLRRNRVGDGKTSAVDVGVPGIPTPIVYAPGVTDGAQQISAPALEVGAVAEGSSAGHGEASSVAEAPLPKVDGAVSAGTEVKKELDANMIAAARAVPHDSDDESSEGEEEEPDAIVDPKEALEQMHSNLDRQYQEVDACVGRWKSANVAMAPIGDMMDMMTTRFELACQKSTLDIRAAVQQQSTRLNDCELRVAGLEQHAERTTHEQEIQKSELETLRAAQQQQEVRLKELEASLRQHREGFIPVQAASNLGMPAPATPPESWFPSEITIYGLQGDAAAQQQAVVQWLAKSPNGLSDRFGVPRVFSTNADVNKFVGILKLRPPFGPRSAGDAIVELEIHAVRAQLGVGLEFKPETPPKTKELLRLTQAAADELAEVLANVDGVQSTRKYGKQAQVQINSTWRTLGVAKLSGWCWSDVAVRRFVPSKAEAILALRPETLW